jgi:hypothetical protein
MGATRIVSLSPPQPVVMEILIRKKASSVMTGTIRMEMGAAALAGRKFAAMAKPFQIRENNAMMGTRRVVMAAITIVKRRFAGTERLRSD